jgi:hypothetical protein
MPTQLFDGEKGKSKQATNLLFVAKWEVIALNQ